MLLFSYYPMDQRPRRAAEALRQEGMAVDLICLSETPTDPKRETVNGVEVRRVPLRRRRGGIAAYVFQYAAFVAISFTLLAARSLRRRYDLVYVNNMPDFLVLGALVPKALGAKVILDLHDPMPELLTTIFGFSPESLAVRVLKSLEAWSIRLADRVITVNVACKRLFASRSCPPEKIRVVMNSPDDKVYGIRAPRPPAVNRSAPSRRFVVMYHGSLVERNGLALAVEAVARIRTSVPGVELRIYGSRTPFLERVMESVRAGGLTDEIRYLGPSKRHEDIVDAIARCDVGIVPNTRSVFTEINTPTRIFEFLALGKPVIAPRAPGIRDYFDEGSLIFFELGDVDDLARQIDYAFRHREETGEIARRGQKVYLAHAWPEERRELVDLTRELLNGGARTA